MGRPRASSVDEATTERVLEAAAHAFGRLGYEAARLEDIAREAGIRRSSLLYHFESKERLYLAVVERAFRQLEQGMEHAARGNAKLETRLKRVVDAMLAFEREHKALLGVLMRGLIDHDEAGVRLVERSFVPLVDRIEQFIRATTSVPRGFPVRAAILQLMIAQLVRSALGPAGDALWKGDAHTWTLAQALLRGVENKGGTNTP